MKNKIYKRVVLKVALLFTISITAYAQDPSLTQVYANPLTLNPAIMGSSGDLKVMFNYRNQLLALDGGYSNTSLGIIYPLYLKGEYPAGPAKKIDIGFNIQNDLAGEFQKINASFAFGYDMKLSASGHVSLAMQFGYTQKSLSTSVLTFDEQYMNGAFSASNPITESLYYPRTSYGDIGFGAMWYYNPTDAKINCYFGISGFHLNSPQESVSLGKDYLPRKFSCQAGIKIIGADKIDVAPNFRFNIQGTTQEIIPGVNVDYRFAESAKLTLGTWYRLSGAMALLLGIEYENISFGYSYDIYAASVFGQIGSGVNANQISFVYKYKLAEKKGVALNASPFSSF